MMKKCGDYEFSVTLVMRERYEKEMCTCCFNE